MGSKSFEVFGHPFFQTQNASFMDCSLGTLQLLKKKIKVLKTIFLLFFN